MYSIVEEQTNSFNGLGANGEMWNAWGKDVANMGLNLVGKYVDAKYGQNNQNANANTNTGGNTYSPVVYVPPTDTTPAPTTQSKSIGDYLPWIVGGIALLGFGYMILKK